MHYLVGDLQGCAGAFSRLLHEIDFSPSRDHVSVLGDLVNRGPQSLGALRTLRDFGDSATCLLGNHDLHLLAVAYGVRKAHRTDTLADVLQAPDREEWLAWIRRRRLAVQQEGWLLVHAGVVPQWNVDTTLALAAKIEKRLRADKPRDFIAAMFGNDPPRWSDDLTGDDRLRFAVNTLTRVRFVAPDGTLDFKAKDAAAAPAGLVPWFDAPKRLTQGVPIAFGHWSSLGLVNRPDLLSLDTGCVWGGALTAARVDGGRREIFQVSCPPVERAA